MEKFIPTASVNLKLKRISLFLLMLTGMHLSGCASTSHDVHSQVKKAMESDMEAMSHDNYAGHNNAGHENAQQNSTEQFTSREHAVTQSSPSRKYKLSLFCDDPEIPLQKIHSWTLHVENAAGEPAGNLKLFVSGGMPMHRHGFPTVPRVSEHLGNGDYRVEGVKFTMAGHWEMRFNINEKEKPLGRDLEQVVFQIHRR